jgi:uncharacterized membrane-anchored protein
MMDLIKGAWAGLTQKGRTVVLVTLLVIVGLVVAYTMYLNYDWSWVPELID